MHGHEPTQPSSNSSPSVEEHWSQPCAASSRSGAPQCAQPLAPAAAFTAAEAVEMAVDRRALLVATAAEDRLAGVEMDGGDHWPVLRHLGVAGRVGDGVTRL